MRKFVVVSVAVAALLLLAGGAVAHMGWGQMGPGMGAYGCPGWGAMGPGMMGPGMMGGYGYQGMGPSMMGGQGYAAPQTQLTEENAKQLAQQYADKYLKGFTVERVLPFAGMGMTMYQAELKGPGGEARVLHINPWGNVMPFGGPWHRGG